MPNLPPSLPRRRPQFFSTAEQFANEAADRGEEGDEANRDHLPKCQRAFDQPREQPRFRRGGGFAGYQRR